MELNVATTVSFCAASTCASMAALGAYLGRRPAGRHFRYVAGAGLAATAYCLTDALLAAGASGRITVWAGRVSVGALCAHAALWVAFLAAWARRPCSRVERGLIIANLLGALVSLIPGWVVLETTRDRTIEWLGVTYRDPDVGPLGLPIFALFYTTEVIAARAAGRMVHAVPRAKVVSAGLRLFCLSAPVDLLSALHVIELPYLADPALALVFSSVGMVVALDAAESADKSVELAGARVALAERENLAALGQLAAVVAHEVRNPVAIILGALGALRRAPRTNEDETLLGIVDEEATRLHRLVTRLLDAVRPFELQYSRGRAASIVEAAVSQVIAGAGVPATQVEVVGSLDDELECDEIMLTHAITNLVQNAVVASGRRSPVRVRSDLDDTSSSVMLRVEVTDDGEGVPPDSRPRLFTPFFTTRATGTGLGLALVKRIAAAHGGTVEHTTPPEGGACFVLRVPMRAADATRRYLIGDDLR